MTEIISNETLFHAILYGAACTREKREDLNRINVFPVVDNDTGNNLAHTMHAILKNAKYHDNVRDTLKGVAVSAMAGARGNSGAIFSQYFSGFYQHSANKASVTFTELAAYFHEAFSKAYAALETPVEGTVITLMRSWALSFKESLEARRSPQALFETALAEIKRALEETKLNLAILRRLGIVDAGALGYYYFMSGFVQAILNPSIRVQQLDEQSLPVIEEGLHNFGEGADIPFRYCTEVLFEFESLDENAFREELRPLGDCLLLSSTENLARVHLHTNQPWQVIDYTSARGKIIEQKADDMILQNLLSGPHENKIACVTDSIADLPQAYIFQHNIFQLPINILIDGVNYLDKITAGSNFLNRHLGRASSAQLNTAQIHSFLAPIIKHYDQVLVLTVSSQMSGTYDRFKEALADMENAGEKIALIDTKVNSGAQGLLVRSAAGMIESGMPFQQIVAAIEELKSRAKIVVSVLDIEPMARSGRVSEKIGDLLIKLHFKPLVVINKAGKGTIKGIAFSAQRNQKILLKSLRGKKMEDYVIVHADAPERAATLQTEMIHLTGKPPLYVTTISSVVTLFAGRGSVAVAYLEKPPA